ncbi:MAG TPA: dTDP-glucose 4,6-dehydratase [Terracidiphilus sp.]|nr:dTDP-glucose 4,6-dehydratase [Terracidiphilus sp.]
MNSSNSILVTGGAGFIGSNFVLQWAAEDDSLVVTLDLLTYAGNAANLASLGAKGRHILVQGDTCDANLVATLLRRHRPRIVVHFAAESHVDRSISAPDAFIRTNVFGTFTLLEQAKAYWSELDETSRRGFRFLHVSTDEVYGSLASDAPPFSERTPYAPNSPYAASKAASDHLARAYFHTYGLPTITTNCSNNYGPYQFPEKLIPLMILNSAEGKPLPIYGDGKNIRDWLFVEDHCEALRMVLECGRPGASYNIGGKCERTNLQVVIAICDTMDELVPRPNGSSHKSLISYIADRPGHDRRYAIDSSRIESELGWRPRMQFEEGLRKTIMWYLENRAWVEDVRTGAYKDWIRTNYEERVMQ